MSLKASSEQIRRANKKRPAVTLETRFKLPAVRIEAVVIEIVIVTDVKSRAWIRVIAK